MIGKIRMLWVEEAKSHEDFDDDEKTNPLIDGAGLSTTRSPMPRALYRYLSCFRRCADMPAKYMNCVAAIPLSLFSCLIILCLPRKKDISYGIIYGSDGSAAFGDIGGYWGTRGSFLVYYIFFFLLWSILFRLYNLLNRVVKKEEP